MIEITTLDSEGKVNQNEQSERRLGEGTERHDSQVQLLILQNQPINDACPQLQGEQQARNGISGEMADLEIEEDVLITFPDGGRDAWLAVFGSWLVHTVVIGLPATYGVFQQYYATNPNSYVGPHSSSAISIIGSILNCLLGLVAIPAGRLAEVWGNRTMAAIGAISVGTSLLLASFAQTYWQLVLTQGVLFGISCPIAYFPALTIISHYFDKRKGLATGIAVSGSGLGGLAMSPVIRSLLS